MATALYRIADLPRGYWVPVTVAFVLKPDFGGTFSRGVQRYAGTAIGVILATAITALLNPGYWTLIVLVGIFAVGIYMFIFANYLLFATSITALIVFFVAFDGVAEWTAVTDRVLDTLIGGALHADRLLIFPTWEGERVSGRLADLIEADRRYLAAVLGAWVDPATYDADALHEVRLRRAARPHRGRGVGADRAGRALQAPWRHRHRRSTCWPACAGWPTARWRSRRCSRTSRRAPRDPRCGPLAHELGRALTELERGRARRPARAGPCRRCGTSTTRWPGRAGDAPVALETDCMVNVVDTLAHLVKPAPPVRGPSAPAARTAGARS